MKERSSRVRNLAVAGKSTSTRDRLEDVGKCCRARTKKRQESNSNSSNPFLHEGVDMKENIFMDGRTRMKIQDQPNNLWVPLIKLIPYANRPLNAPAKDAAPKNKPIRHCNMWRGYQRERLAAFQRRGRLKSFSLLVNHAAVI